MLFITSIPAHSGLLDGLGGSDDFLPVEQAFPLETYTEPGQITAHWQNADGYYLYEHRLYLTQGAVRIDPATWSKDGKEKYDEAFGDIVAYYGQLEVSRHRQPDTRNRDSPLSGLRRCGLVLPTSDQ